MELVIGFLAICICKVMIIRSEDIQPPRVTVKINTLPVDIHVGGAVELQCDVTGINLLTAVEFIVEWKRPARTILWNGTSYDNKYTVRSLTYDPKMDVLSQHVIFSPIALSDSDVYTCNLKVFQPYGGSDLLSSNNVSLSIPHFPDSSPVCSPNGPLIVALDQHLGLSCSSAPGYPTITITVMQKSVNVTGMFVNMATGDILSRQHDVTVRLEDDGASFVCSITSPHHFPLIQSSCTMGPLIIYPSINKPTTTPTSIPDPESTPTHLPSIDTTLTSPTGSTRTSASIPGSNASNPEDTQMLTIAALASSIVILGFLLTLLCVIFSYRSHGATKSSSSKTTEETLSSNGPIPECHVLDFEIYNPEQWPRRGKSSDVLWDIPEAQTENFYDEVPMYDTGLDH